MNSPGGAAVGHNGRWATLTAFSALLFLTILAVAAACSIDIHLGTNRAVPERAIGASVPDEELIQRELTRNGMPIILDEQFDGTSLDLDVWNTCHWWDDEGCTIASNNELEWYLPGQVQVSDGVLRLTAEQREVLGADGEIFPYVSGMVSTGPPEHDGEPKLAFTYGTVEVQFRAPLGAGLWPAIWMLPASEESKPEIDIFEAVGQQPRRASMYFHPRRESEWEPTHARVYFPPGVDLADTHSVRLEWSPGRLDFYFDGQKVWEVTGERVPDEPMYLVMNLAVGGDYGGPPDPSAFPATFEIDYARIWSESPE